MSSKMPVPDPGGGPGATVAAKAAEADGPAGRAWLAADREALSQARRQLESETLGMRLTHGLGLPVARALEILPKFVGRQVQAISQAALLAAGRTAVRSLGHGPSGAGFDLRHRLAAGAVGAVGGALGLVGLAVELPVSTTLILRASAGIARSEGEDLRDPAARLACIEIFALGGRASQASAEADEIGYFAVRAGLTRAVSEAARLVLQVGVLEEGAPVVRHLMVRLANRFGPLVGEKMMASALPILGAVGGAAVNSIFMAHFQQVAHGHFSIRRLERVYGAAVVRERYEAL